MPYVYDRLGRLRASSQGYPVFASRNVNTNVKTISDTIRLPQFYVESQHEIQPGHPVQWTGHAAMINTDGTRLHTFSQTDYSAALSSVEPAIDDSNTIAGIVIEKAAETGDRFFTHKGVHSRHNLPSDINKLYRVGNDIALAWVLEESEGEIEGIYQRYVNGQLDDTGPYQLTMVSSDTFVINRTIQAAINLELATLKARFDSLTTNQ